MLNTLNNLKYIDTYNAVAGAIVTLVYLIILVHMNILAST